MSQVFVNLPADDPDRRIRQVVSLKSRGITAIGTRPTGRDGKTPMDVYGIRLSNGRTVPSYDWIAPAFPIEDEPLAP